MRETSGRLLALLGLLQTPRTWPAADLAARLGVGERTVRKDVERLRELDYPIDTFRGPRGGYRLGDHGKLPPLLLDDVQAVTAVRGIEESSALALAKLEHVLPSRLRRRVRALHDSTSTGPADTATNVAAPPVDPALLTEMAVAVRDSTGIRFVYREDEHLEAASHGFQPAASRSHWKQSSFFPSPLLSQT